MGGMMAGQGIGEAISGIGRVMGDRARRKEWKTYQRFLREVYNAYINDPGRKEAVNMVYKLLATGDYQDIFRNALVEGLERSKANLLAGERRAQDVSARGGLLRSGQQQDLLGRQREAQFAADRGAYRDFASNQFGAKTWAAGMADQLAKGPFEAGTEVAAPININPYTGYVWNEVANAGQVIAGMFGGGKSGVQSTGQQVTPYLMNSGQLTGGGGGNYMGGQQFGGYQMPTQNMGQYQGGNMNLLGNYSFFGGGGY